MFRIKFLTVLIITTLSVESLESIKEDTIKFLSKVKADQSFYRLPGETIPSDYTITLEIDPNMQESFYGEVSIIATAKFITGHIVLHSNIKNITNIEVISSATENSDIYANYTLSGDDRHFLIIELLENLIVDESYRINIKYYGAYGTSLVGLYLSSYKDDNNNDRFLATTQFESVYARDAFPCYDEPGLKARFQMNIYVPDGYHALSNNDLTNDSSLPLKRNRLSRFSFEKTIRMSSYLVALVVSDYIYISNFDQGNVIFPKSVRVYAMANTEQYMNIAMEHSQKSMKFIEDYINITYAFNKVDNVAIPDFRAAAMENWGLITYREPVLLYRPDNQTTTELQKIITVINHENGHLWFGNEISPAWWDYVWLSEGFAAYFEFFASDSYAPEWRLMDQYLQIKFFNAMLVDSKETTNPMTTPVATPKEIDDNFNQIAYDKASSVVHMMKHVFGDDIFRQGINNYFRSIPLGSGRPEILFAAFQEAVGSTQIFPNGITVSDVYGSWSTQAGVPIVRAVKSNDKQTLILTQERYYEDPNLSSSESWWIPINWMTSKNISFDETAPQAWLRPFVNNLQIPMDLTNNAWYILNKKVTGYYRIMYDEENWKLLIDALKTENFRGIHLQNRLQLLSDAMEFVRTFRLTPDIGFDLLYYLKEDIDFLPWFTLYSTLNNWNNLMPGSENYQLYREFIRQISKKTFDSLGLDTSSSDNYIDKMNRNHITNIACNAGNEDCLQQSNDKLNRLMQNNSVTFHPDVRSIIYCTGMRQASENMWNFFFDRYTNAVSNFEKITILKGLSCSENSEILQKYLSMTIVNGSLESSYRYAVIESILNAGYIGVDNTVDFVINNFDAIKSSMQSSTVNILKLLGQRIITKEHIDRFDDFSDTFPNFNSQERTNIDDAMIVINNNRNWLDVILKDLDPWLIENVIL